MKAEDKLILYWDKYHKMQNISYSPYSAILSKVSGMINTTDICVLEVGCGSGEFLKKLSIIFKRLYACDVSEEALKRIPKNLCKHITIRKSVYNKIPFDDNQFSIIFMSQAFSTISEEFIKQTVHEIRRVAKNESLIVIADYALSKKNSYMAVNLDNLLLNVLKPEWSEIQFIHYEPLQLESLFQPCSLRVNERIELVTCNNSISDGFLLILEIYKKN